MKAATITILGGTDVKVVGGADVKVVGGAGVKVVGGADVKVVGGADVKVVGDISVVVWAKKVGALKILVKQNTTMLRKTKMYFFIINLTISFNH